MASNPRGGRRRKKICDGEGSEGINSSTSSLVPVEDVVALSPAEKLPPEMFHRVFKKLDKKCLANSRLVCTTWRNTIDANGQLMKSLTFTIVDIKPFMESKLATQVKSVRFIQPLKGAQKALEEFFAKIGSTVEEVFIDFEKHDGNPKEEVKTKRIRDKLMFSMMLRFCIKLNSLTIAIASNDLIKGCTEDRRNDVTLSMIQNLSVIAKAEFLEDLKTLVVNLPNLRKLDLNCGQINRGRFHMILDHLRKYNGKLQEITLENVDNVGVRNWKKIIKLLVSVGELCPNTTIECLKCPASLNLLLNVEDEEEEIFDVNRISCRAITTGKLEFYDEEEDIDVPNATVLDTNKIGYCSNLHSLDIQIKIEGEQTNFSTKLGFIQGLKKLAYLRIKDELGEEVEEEEEILLTGEFFLFGIPSLTTLDFDGELIGTSSVSFHLCFPNLAKLYIRNYSGHLNLDFIHNLRHLDQLKSLTLENLKHLTDAHLIRAYDFVVYGKACMLPAIAGLLSLKHLHITGCHELTDNSLENGLALCTKLDKITLCWSKGKEKFTTIGLNAFQQARDFKVEDLSSSHGKKHSVVITDYRRNLSINLNVSLFELY